MSTHSIHQRELFRHHLWGEGEEIRLPVPDPVLLHQLERAAAVLHSCEKWHEAEHRRAATSSAPHHIPCQPLQTPTAHLSAPNLGLLK